MLFALTRSNLLRQLPNRNGIILQLTEIVSVSNSIGTYFWRRLHINLDINLAVLIVCCELDLSPDPGIRWSIFQDSCRCRRKRRLSFTRSVASMEI